MSGRKARELRKAIEFAKSISGHLLLLQNEITGIRNNLKKHDAFNGQILVLEREVNELKKLTKNINYSKKTKRWWKFWA